MNFRYPPAAEAFRAEVRSFLDEVITPEYLEEQRTRIVDTDGHGPATQNFVDRLRDKGWLTLHWPREYGGQGRSIFEQAVFNEEIAKAGASTFIIGHVGLTMVASALMVYGSEQQKRDILPKIAKGEVNFCQMFTEPSSGSDLASLQTRAVRDGDDYVVDGTKIFITWGHLSTHGYLLARTDPDAPKHRGLTLFMLDMSTPGVDIRPLTLLRGGRHSLIYLENVRIPASAVIGEVNRGWYHAAVTLDFERAGIGSITRGEREIHKLLNFARTNSRGGRKISEEPAIRQGLLQSYRDVRLSRALGLKVLDIQARGLVANAEASESNVHGKESAGRLSITKSKVFGMHGQLLRDSPHVVADGDGVDSWWVLAGRHPGGTEEIQKNIIAQRGLGLPR